MRRRLLPWLAVVTIVVTACTDAAESAPPEPPGASTRVAGTEPVDTTTDPERSYAGTEPAPEFPSGLDWLNTDGPLSLAGLRGKAVLLDFWTYGCINCIHIIPDLKRLEAEFAEELVVIGVHSAKFQNEGETENIRQVILRYGVEHPVVNDRDFEVWRTWGANAWPTVVLIDPAGNVVGGHSGEGVYATVAPVLQSLIAEFDQQGLVDRSPIEFALEAAGRAQTPLSFPGKVTANAAGDTLYVADTGHHRIVEVDAATGEVQTVFGSGTQGFRNGFGFDARFDSPQGMALSEDEATLYVADTNNHAIRTIDLASGVVETLVGVGEIGWPPTGGIAPDVRLNSPWDVERRDGVLYVAMAGSHQLWSIDLATGLTAPLVGNARESTRNGPIAEAELAQPSGLAFDETGRLYFADSESSSIRYADVIEAGGSTGVVAGADQDLFSFGAEDGNGTDARFQHPLGVVFSRPDNALYVADTYNSRLRRIDLSDNSVTTFAGSEQGWADGADPRFYEPGGLHLVDGVLWVADTNNHSIRRVEVATGQTSTVVLSGIERFNPVAGSDEYRGTTIELEPITAGPGPGSFVLDIDLPPEHKVNEQAPSSVQWTVAGEAVSLAADADRSLTGVTFPVDIGADLATGSSTVTADLTVIYCREDAESLCFIEQVRFLVPVTVAADGPSARIVLAHGIALPGG